MKGRDEEHAGRTKIRLPLRLDDLLCQMFIFTSTNLRQCLSVADIGSVFVEIPRGRRRTEGHTEECQAPPQPSWRTSWRSQRNHPQSHPKGEQSARWRGDTWTGMKGQTSQAPIRGCSPWCFLISMSSLATLQALKAPSTTASGEPTKVQTVLLVDLPASTSRRVQPANDVKMRMKKEEF